MMAVDFCDYFWGEKHDGFNVIYQNMKAGLVAARDLTDVARETALMQENSAKVYTRISKQLGSNTQTGSFQPMLAALKASAEKLATIHTSTLTKVNELVKDLVRYSEELHKKHKQIKDEESGTSDVVKSLIETSALLGKTKEFYKAKSAELEKLKRESPSPKELEKAETKFRKAQDDYKALCDKYASVREDFEKKMLSSCKHFQQAETLYLTQMVDFIHSFHDLVDRGHQEVGKVNLELEESVVSLPVEKMLEQFVLQKYTGLVKPGPVEFEAENISLSSLNAVLPTGPPSDISDRSANSDKAAPSGSLAVKKESGGFLKKPISNRKAKKKKSKGGKEDGEEGKEMGSDGEERRSETPTPEHGELEDSSGTGTGAGGSYRETPPSISLPGPASDPWADFNQPASRKNFYSSSDSDSDDDEVKKTNKWKGITIKPATAGPSANSSASVDELQRVVGGLDISATLPTKGRSKSVMREALAQGSQTLRLKKRPTPSAELSNDGQRSQSTQQLHMAPSHSQDLLGLFPPAPPLPTSLPPDSDDPAPGQNDTALSNISSVPGAESTRLDSSNVETSEGQINQSQISNNSREVSALLNDIQDLQNDIKEAQSPPEEHPNGDGGEKGDGWGALGGAQEFGGGVESATAWPDSPAFSDAPQPALPAKQRPRPASVARERVANSLISVARPRPGSSLAARASPSSSLFSSALSLPPRDPPPPRERIDSTSSNQSVASLASRTLTSVQRTDSTGSASSLTRGSTGPVGHSGVNNPTRMGPLLPRPHSGSSSPSSGRPDSPGGPPSGPPPILHPHRAPSRGPSPLAVGGADSVPLAVAFQEVVHAAFRGSDESKCMVRLLGDMMLSFPAGIVSVLAANPYPAPLQFRILNAGRLESVLPNKQLIHKVKNLCTSDLLVFEFNMQSLQELLVKQSQMNPHASYFNIDILKYQISCLSGAHSCPIHLMSYWRCEEGHTDLRVDYKYNQHAMARSTALQNLSLAVPVDGGVTSMMSEPKGTWVQESSRAMWKFPELGLSSPGSGVGSIRARFQLKDGPGYQGTIAAQFNCEGTTLSGVEFELSGSGYRVSLVKRRFVSGKYVSEPDVASDRFRYAAPGGLGSDC